MRSQEGGSYVFSSIPPLQALVIGSQGKTLRLNRLVPVGFDRSRKGVYGFVLALRWMGSFWLQRSELGYPLRVRHSIENNDAS